MASLRTRLLLLAAALLLGLPAAAQLHRGARTLVRSGLMPKPDSLRAERDSLRLAGLLLEMDSVAAPDYAADSAAVAALRTDARSTPSPRPAMPRPCRDSTPPPNAPGSRRAGS